MRAGWPVFPRSFPMRDIPKWDEALSPHEMRSEWRKPVDRWSKKFLVVVGRLLAQELLDAFLAGHDDEQVRERFRLVIERATEGQLDGAGRKYGPLQ